MDSKVVPGVPLLYLFVVMTEFFHSAESIQILLHAGLVLSPNPHKPLFYFIFFRQRGDRIAFVSLRRTEIMPLVIVAIPQTPWHPNFEKAKRGWNNHKCNSYHDPLSIWTGLNIYIYIYILVEKRPFLSKQKDFRKYY